MPDFLIRDRVWVKNERDGERYPGVVERVLPDTHQVVVQIDDGPKIRVYVGAVTLRETHE